MFSGMPLPVIPNRDNEESVLSRRADNDLTGTLDGIDRVRDDVHNHLVQFAGEAREKIGFAVVALHLDTVFEFYASIATGPNRYFHEY